MERVRGHILKDMAASQAESATTRRVGIDNYLFTITHSPNLAGRAVSSLLKSKMGTLIMPILPQYIVFCKYDYHNIYFSLFFSSMTLSNIAAASITRRTQGRTA